MKELKINLGLISILGLMLVTVNHIDVLAVHEKIMSVLSIPTLLTLIISRI